MSGLAILLAVAYLGGLVLLARQGERWRGTPRGVRLARWLPGLALGVYCTTWTYYGAVGRAVEAGFSFLPIYLGPVLLYSFAFPVVERIHRRSKEQSSGSIADLLSLRYGRRRTVAVVATLIAAGASLPYIALQLQAVSTSLGLLAGEPTTSSVPAVLALALGAFAGVFGARSRETTDPRPGLVTAVAAESVVKLLALGAVAVFAAQSVDLATIAPTLNSRGSLDEPGFWVVTVLAGFAVLCLPRQFHVMTVEIDSEAGLRRARWIFPVYLALMSLCVAPIAVAGLSLEGPADGLVLLLPLQGESSALALFAFIGGFSAATAMVIVSAYAVGSMVTNEVVLPLFLRASVAQRRSQRLGARVVSIRRFAILGVVMTAYVYLVTQTRTQALATFGLEAFSLIGQLGPALLLGLYWKRAHAHGAIAGMLIGAFLWAIFLFSPVSGAERIAEELGLAPVEAGALVSLGVNLLAVVGVSVLARPRIVDRVQAAAFVHGDAGERHDVTSRESSARVGDLRRLLYMFLDEAHYQRLEALYRHRADSELLDHDEAPDWMLQHSERTLGMVLGAASARDLLVSITEQRQFEIDDVFHLVGGAAEALRFNRSVLYTSLDNVAYGISVIDAHLKLVAWNQRYLELFSYPPGMVTVGRPIAELVRFNVRRSGVPDDEVATQVGKRLEHLRQGTTYTTRREVQGRVLELNGRPLPNGGFVTTFSDISEHVAAKEALQRANDTLEETVAARTAEIVKINEALAEAKTQAERANQEKTQFLVAAGHDILQPLSAARLFLTAALESETRDQRTALMNKLGDSLAAAEDLIADLYEISKLDHGALEPEWVDVGIGDILEQLVTEARPLAEFKGLELRYVPCERYTRSDPRYLRRIIGNFINNAIKYTQKGKVLVGVRLCGSALRVEVWDTGPGIPEQERGRVFEDFYRLPDARRESGSGLGLSVVRRMAHALCADVELRSTVGRGSCFAIALPRLPVRLRRPALLVEPSEWSVNASTLLYLDDEHANIEALAALVANWGCAVIGFEEVEDALAHARAMPPPDVLVVDYQLENDMNGIEVARRLGECWTREVPTLIVTAWRDSDVRARAIDAGYFLLHKPLKPAALRSTLRHLLMRGDGHSTKNLEASSTA